MKRWIGMLLFGWIAVSGFCAEPDWKRTGPVAGNIEQIVPDRAHPDIWYMVENQDGRLYRSVDNGNSWENTRIVNVKQVLVHSVSSEVFVVSNGKGNNEWNLFSSTDLGQTFQLRSGKGPERIFDHPTDPRILWGSGIGYNGYDLSVSFDRGVHWQIITNLKYKVGNYYTLYGEKLPLDSYYLSSVMVSPLDGKTVFVSIEAAFEEGCGGEYLDMELISTNNGASWSNWDAEVPFSRYVADPAFPNRAFALSYDKIRILTGSGWKFLSPRHFETIVSVPGKPEKLVALNDGRQWVSGDGGVNWRSVDIGPAGKARVLAARTDPEGTFLGGGTGSGLYIVDETGGWRPVTDGLREAYVNNVVTAPGSTVVFAVTGINSDRFLYRSLNSGQTWKNITDNLATKLGSYGYITLVVDPRSGRHIIAIVNGKMNVSFDAGDTWVVTPLNNIQGAFFTDTPGPLYVSQGNHNHLFQSTDGGISVKELPAEIGNKGNTINDVVVDRYNGYVYMATHFGLYLSRDKGASAVQIAADLNPDCTACRSYRQIISLPLRGQYLAVAEDAVFKSVNGGTSWQELTQNSGELHVADNLGQHLYLIYGRLLESTDGGHNWQNVSSTIAPRLGYEYGRYVSGMSDPRVFPIYLSTTIGMYRADR